MFEDIIRHITADANNHGINLPNDLVYRIVRLFFLKIIQHINNGDKVKVEGFGRFGFTTWGRELKIKDEKKKYLKEINDFYKH